MVETKLAPVSFNVPLTYPDTGFPTPYFERMLQILFKEKAATDALAEEAVSQEELGDALESLELDDLADVDTTSTPPTDGQVLLWVNADGQWEPGDAANSIDDLTDVDTTSTPPTDGQALIWVDADSMWEPGDVSSGGATFSGARITNSGAITPTTGAITNLTTGMNTEVFDEGGYVNVGTNAGRMTVPSTGYYSVFCQIRRSASVADQFVAHIQHYNSSNTLLKTYYGNDVESAGGDNSQCFTGPVSAAAGDYFLGAYFITTAGNLDADSQIVSIVKLAEPATVQGQGYFNGFSGAIVGTLDTQNFATKGHYYTPDVTIEVSAIYAAIGASAASQAHHGHIASVNSGTGAIGTVVGSTANNNSTTTSTIWYRYAFSSPVTLVANTTYLIAAVNASGTGTTPVRLAGSATGWMNAPAGNPLHLSSQFRYNTIDTTASQAVSGSTAAAGYNICIEGRIAL